MSKQEVESKPNVPFVSFKKRSKKSKKANLKRKASELDDNEEEDDDTKIQKISVKGGLSSTPLISSSTTHSTSSSKPHQSVVGLVYESSGREMSSGRTRDNATATLDIDTEASKDEV